MSNLNGCISVWKFILLHYTLYIFFSHFSDFLVTEDRNLNVLRTNTLDSGIWEGLDDGLISRWGWRCKAKSKVAVGPVEIWTTQTVGGVDRGRETGGRKSHQVTVRVHWKWRTLQKWMECWSAEAWFSWEGVCLFHGCLSLESETGQAEVAPAFIATVAVKSSPVKTMGVRRPCSPMWTPLGDGGTGSSPRQANQQSPNESSNHEPDSHRHSEGYDNVLPEVFWPRTP